MRAPLPFLFALALLTLPALSQRLWLASNDDDTHNMSSAIGWPSGTVAMRFVASSTTSIAAAQVFTGNGVGTNWLAVWSHDTVNDRPGAPLQAKTAWSMLRQRVFQGVEFVPPIAVSQGQTYWLVWDVVNFTQNSVGNGAANLDVRVSADGGTSWQAPVTWAAQFRLYEPATTGWISSYGTAKPGVNGDPTIGISGWPTVGNPLDVWLDTTARRVPALLLAGFPTQQVTPLGTLWVTPAYVGVYQTYFVNFSGALLIGSLGVSFRVPNVPAAAGLPLSFQWAVLDPAAAQGLSHSAAMTAILL